MSVLLMARVWTGSPYRLGTRLVHLAIADISDDRGNSTVSIADIAQKAQLSPRLVQNALRVMEAQGYIRITPEQGARGESLLTMTFPSDAPLAVLSDSAPPRAKSAPLQNLHPAKSAPLPAAQPYKVRARAHAPARTPAQPQEVSSPNGEDTFYNTLRNIDIVYGEEGESERGEPIPITKPIRTEPIRSAPPSSSLSGAVAPAHTQKGRRPALKVDMPEGWQPNPERVRLMQEKHPNIDIGLITEEFINWIRSTGRQFIDYQAAWNNAVIRGVARAEFQAPSSPRGESGAFKGVARGARGGGGGGGARMTAAAHMDRNTRADAAIRTVVDQVRTFKEQNGGHVAAEQAGKSAGRREVPSLPPAPPRLFEGDGREGEG